MKKILIFGTIIILLNASSNAQATDSSITREVNFLKDSLVLTNVQRDSIYQALVIQSTDVIAVDSALNDAARTNRLTNIYENFNNKLHLILTSTQWQQYLLMQERRRLALQQRLINKRIGIKNL